MDPQKAPPVYDNPGYATQIPVEQGHPVPAPTVYPPLPSATLQQEGPKEETQVTRVESWDPRDDDGLYEFTPHVKVYMLVCNQAFVCTKRHFKVAFICNKFCLFVIKPLFVIKSVSGT